MQEEIWKPVVGYEGSYEVSSLGQVRSLERSVVYSDGRRRMYASILLKQYMGNYYRMVHLSSNGKPTTQYVHHLVASAFRRRRKFQTQIRHLNGNPHDNRADNLLFGTSKENHSDAVRHGSIRLNPPKGEAHGMSALKSKDVLKIRKLKSIGYSRKKLSYLFSVTKEHIDRIVSRRSWKHI